MKTVYAICGLCLLILFSACKKEINNNSLQSEDISGATASTGPVKTPKIVMASSTKSQFIANADGSGAAQITYRFTAKKPGIKIVSFTFLAYETDSDDAFSLSLDDYNLPFEPTTNYPPAKAMAVPEVRLDDPDGPHLAILLPDDGSSVPVTFTIHYNTPGFNGKVKSGDTVSVKLIGVEAYDNSIPDPPSFEDLEADPSPAIMLTGAKPFLGLNIYDPDVLHKGLTRILDLEYDSYGGSLGINNLPLIVKCTNAKIRPSLVVKDELGNTINTTTSRKGNKYTIQFPEGYGLNGVNAHTFFVYAHVFEIDGQASITAQFQPASNFSWTDIAGGKTQPYTTENAIYFKKYPRGQVTVTKN
jgi:hypothetical protein